MKHRTHLVPFLRAGEEDENPRDEYIVEACALFEEFLEALPFDWLSRCTSNLILCKLCLVSSSLRKFSWRLMILSSSSSLSFVLALRVESAFFLRAAMSFSCFWIKRVSAATIFFLRISWCLIISSFSTCLAFCWTWWASANSFCLTSCCSIFFKFKYSEEGLGF